MTPVRTLRDLRALAATPCPKCGDVPRLVAHLVDAHGFSPRRAKSVAGKLGLRVRLGRGESIKLGLVPQPVKLKGGMRQAPSADAIPGLPALPSPEDVAAMCAAMFGGPK